MSITVKRNIDDQGRVVLPSHIRQELNLGSGSMVEITMDENKTISIKPIADNCCICGKSLEDKKSIRITKQKNMCVECAEAVAKVM